VIQTYVFAITMKKITRRELLAFSLGTGTTIGSIGVADKLGFFEKPRPPVPPMKTETESTPNPLVAEPSTSTQRSLNKKEDPKAYAAYEAAYNGLLELLTAAERKNTPEPTPLILSDSEEGHDTDINGEYISPCFVCITKAAYDEGDQARMTTIFAHEIGHMLYENNPAAAIRISGINRKPAQDLLKKLKRKIQHIYPDDTENQKAIYEEFKSELIADGIEIRSTCNLQASTNDLIGKDNQDNQDFLDSMLDGMHVRDDDRGEIAKIYDQLRDEIKKRALEDTHPFAEQRVGIMRSLAERYCKTPRGAGRGK